MGREGEWERVCVWCTVVGSPVVEHIFLEQGGVFALLHLFKVV